MSKQIKNKILTHQSSKNQRLD